MVLVAAMMLASCAGNQKKAAAAEGEATEQVEATEEKECTGECENCPNAAAEGEETPAEAPAEEAPAK